MKIIKKILFFLPIMLLVIGVNFFGDVNMQFHKYSKIREICETFDKGYNIQSEMVNSINKRQLVKVHTEYHVPETIVIGSSRTMQLTGDILEEKDFYNCSVGYAVLEDYVGILEMYAQNALPDKVIIGVDPWIFNQNNTDTGVEQAKFWDYEAGNWKRRLGYDVEPPILDKYKNKADLFSLAYFQDSLKQLFVDTSVNSIKQDSVENGPIYTYEGVKLSKEDNWDIASKDGVIMRAKGMQQGQFYNYTELGLEQKRLFEKSIEYLQEHNVEVVILLIPFHPDMVEFFKNSMPIYFDVEAYLVNYANEHGISCYGSYEPEKCGILGEYFYTDGVHIREICAYKNLMAYER